MKLAVISPHSLLDWTIYSSYQLALPHLDNKEYIEHYQKLADRDDHIILDNGVAEGWDISPKKVHEFAKEIGAREIILPDTMGNQRETLQQVYSALESDILEPDRFAYMAVVQGQTMDEFEKCVEVWLDKTEIKALGIPRHMLKTCGSKHARVTLASWIVKEFGDSFEIHFLGMDGDHPLEAKDIGIAFNNYDHYMVRGLDTSLPFNYAYGNISLKKDNATVSRPVDYFDLPKDAFSNDLVKSNIHALKDWLRVPR